MQFRKSTAGLVNRLSAGIAVLGLLAAGLLYFINEKVVDAGTLQTSHLEVSGGKCSDMSLRGEYAVMGEGWVPNGPPGTPMVPFANVSLMSLDGNGNLINDITVSRNGQITRNIDSGTYSIGENCKGTMTVNIPTPPFQLTFDLVVADNAKEFIFIATTPSVVTHQAKRL